MKESTKTIITVMVAVFIGTFIASNIRAAGEIGNDGRFIAYDNGTVLDAKTKLMWAAKDNSADINWADAKLYCRNYRGGGYSDWRMPAVDELLGLYDAKKSRPSACDKDLNIHVTTELIDITCLAQWASGTRGQDAAWFSYAAGKPIWDPQSYHINGRVLPVRSANR